MPFYVCKVLNELGKPEKKVIEASDEISLGAILRSQKYILVKANKIVEKKPNVFFSVSGKVKPSEVILFLRQFAVMINASISIADSLGGLKQQNYSKAFQKVLIDVHTDVVSGQLLSEAFNKHPEVFPHFFVEMVAIGEVSGSLDKVLESMADYYENEQKIKKKASSAMIYPKLLIAMIIIVIAFLSVFILPKFEGMFAEYSAELPKITKIIFSMSHFINNNFKYILTIGVAIFCSINIFFFTKKGMYVRDYINITFPIVGSVNRATIVSRFTKAFVILLKSGMHITDCMENLTRIFGNKVFESKFGYSIEEVKRGKRIAKSIENTKMFPSMLTEMINVGENTGNLEEVLQSTAMFYDSQVETTIAKATAAIEPIIILILGGVAVVVLLSVYLPMIQIMNYI